MRRMCGWMGLMVVLAGVVGCKPSEAVKQGAEAMATKPAGPPAPTVPLDPATLGTVSGVFILRASRRRGSRSI